MGRRRRKPTTPLEWVDSILTEGRVVYFGVKHYSPVCAWHVAEVIRQLQPVGVLVEAPDDATALIPHIVDEHSQPPFTLLSTYVDRKNAFGLNGVLSPNAEVPARYRGWWPFVRYSPEYQALMAGHEVGAQLAFIDTPLPATIPYRQVRKREASSAIDDERLATSRYFEALAKRQRRRDFEEFWQATFEVDGLRLDPLSFMRRVLLFAWCARHVGGEQQEALEADGTLLREAHMRWCIDRFCKQNPEGYVVVVTGAFHSVALPFTKRKRARAKADRNTETLLTSHSYRALSSLYAMNTRPQHGDVVWEQLRAGADEPFNAAAMQLLVEIQRNARAEGSAVSTADTVGAYRVARNLAVLRGNRQVTLADLQDAVQMAYVKGDLRVGGPEIERAAKEVLVGARLGRVTPAAGQVPLLRDFYVQCKTHRLDVSGAQKTVRCDVLKQEKHRLKSAFLHQCDLLGIPLFAGLVNKRRSWRVTEDYYRGPDLVSGENLHLITETWGIRWTEEVDSRLLELADRGASVASAASSLLLERLALASGHAADTSKLLLRCAQMLLLELFDEVISAVEEAVEEDSSFDHLASALSDFVVLHSYRDALATQGHERLLETIVGVYRKACLVLPGIGNVQGERVAATLDQLQSLVRISLTFRADSTHGSEATPRRGAVLLDRELLLDKIRELVADLDANAALRGAGYGILYSFAATREKVVARELESYLLGSPERARQAGAFLDGLFSTSKSIFMGSPRLLRAINRVLGELDWATFKLILPDLRRAFTQFIPAELDGISERVAVEIGIDDAPDSNEPVPAALTRLGYHTEARVVAILADWITL